MARLACAFDPADGRGPLPLASSGPASTAGVRFALDGFVSNLPAVAQANGVQGDQTAEVLAAAWARSGEAFLRDLRGDFAFVLWDQRRRTGLVVRDQLGGRAVYLHRAGTRLLFASELRDLLRLLTTKPAPDRISLLHWVSMQDPRGPRTLYEGVDALLPGHGVRLSPGGWEVFQWWAPRYEQPLRSRRAELVERVGGAVESAVRRSSPENEVTGVLMSGGLDSTSVAAMAQRRCDPPQRPRAAYSLVYPSVPSADESSWIDLVTRELDLKSVRYEAEPTSLLAGALAYIDEWGLPPRPRTFSVLLPLLHLAAADGVTTLLDGEGGDLLFGAPAALIADRVRRGRLAGAVGLARRYPGAGSQPPLRAVLQLVREYGLRGALPAGLHQRLRTRGDLSRHLPSWIPPADARGLVEHDGRWDWKRLDGPRWWAQLAEAFVGGLQALDIRGDLRRRGDMAGLRSCSPLLDLDLVELVLRLPPELAFDPLLGRPMLREAMAGVLPEPVRLRPDKSFLDEFTRRSLDHDVGAIRRLLGDRKAELGAFIDMQRVRDELLDPSRGRHEPGLGFTVTALWRLATAECWLRQQADAGFAIRLLEAETGGR